MFLCKRSDLKNHLTLGVTVNDKQYLLIDTDDQPKAYLNRCPHLSIPLEWQENAFLDADSGLIRCATHGALFLPSTGECVSGPCTGDKLSSIAIRMTDDSIYLAQ